MSKHHLLVGGSSGIGLATAKALLAAGHRLSAAARQAAPLASLGIPVLPFDALAPELDPAGFPDRLDGLVYFPGSINLKPFHRLTAEDFLADLRVNCLGAVAAIQAALPALKKSGSASVVLFSTVAVAQGMPFHASIAAAKGAVEGLAKSLAAEFAPGIRVNVIAPSLTDTPLAAPLLNSEAKREAAAKRHPLQRVGSAEEVAELVAFLLSDASKSMSGQILRPDGGLSSLRLFA
jgi:NAD(P)-dependent dehydrogenase (short-subunit alcohol dehydrogenase family)